MKIYYKDGTYVETLGPGQYMFWAEDLEKIAGNSKLNVVLGEKGLADRVVNLL